MPRWGPRVPKGHPKAPWGLGQRAPARALLPPPCPSTKWRGGRVEGKLRRRRLASRLQASTCFRTAHSPASLIVPCTTTRPTSLADASCCLCHPPPTLLVAFSRLRCLGGEIESQNLREDSEKGRGVAAGKLPPAGAWP